MMDAGPTPVARHPIPQNRVTIHNVAEWQDIRAAHDQYGKDATHNLIHIIKALGPAAGVLEHRHHHEDEEKVDEKRYADLIIHAIWFVRAMGYDPAALVSNRMWQIGIAPKRTELPPSERQP